MVAPTKLSAWLTVACSTTRFGAYGSAVFTTSFLPPPSTDNRHHHATTSTKPTIIGVQLRGSFCALRAPNKTSSAGTSWGVGSFGSVIAGSFYQCGRSGGERVHDNQRSRKVIALVPMKTGGLSLPFSLQITLLLSHRRSQRLALLHEKIDHQLHRSLFLRSTRHELFLPERKTSLACAPLDRWLALLVERNRALKDIGEEVSRMSMFRLPGTRSQLRFAPARPRNPAR